MKNSTFGKTVLLLLVTFLLHACGGTTGGSNSNLSNDSGDAKSGLLGGTETGTTEGGLQVKSNSLSTKIEAAVSALLPNITTSGVEASVSSGISKQLNYGSTSDWNKYLEDSRRYHLTDVFGDPDDNPAPVTRFRVLMRQVAKDVETTFAYDPSNTCYGGKKLKSAASVTVPFFGAIDNGTVKDRAFDCFTEDHFNDIIYGIDGDGVGRIAIMSDFTEKNTESVATRGNDRRMQTITLVTFGEKTESRKTVIYIDVQYAHLTEYTGADNKYDTGDEVGFKSRTRITGRVGLDDDWKPVFATGDFRVTKYDRDLNGDGSKWAGGTKYGGRGSFDGDAYFLFTIDSNMSPLVNLQHDFCIQADDDTGKTLPSQVDEKFCEDLEKEFAWGKASLPFDLKPELNKIFENNDLYERNDTDLIADDGSNFIIPTYKTE